MQPRDRSLDVREMANGRLGKQRGGEKQAKANRQNETNCRNEHGRHNFQQAQVAKPQYTSDFLSACAPKALWRDRAVARFASEGGPT